MKNFYEILEKTAKLYGANIRIAESGEEAGVFLVSDGIYEKIDIETVVPFEAEYECSYWDIFDVPYRSLEIYNIDNSMPNAA